MLEFRHVQLRVSDLTRSIDFYGRQLGFVLVRENPGQAEFATQADGPVLLTLTKDAAALPAPPGAAGLFHAALLLPSRAALGNWVRQVADAGVEFDGFSDHGVSEAIYLRDPDDNGLEFYADRPPAAWPRQNGEIAMFTRPLALPSLLAEGAKSPTDAPLTGARWGHLHLRVTDLERSDKFYQTALGISVTQGTYPGARFLAADGYHHHLGLNTWGRPSQPHPEKNLGLVEATFAQTGRVAEQTLRDPDGMALRLIAG